MLDFGRVSRLEAEAIGEPGQRTFRLRVSSGEHTASLWLEKEQLQALALALMRLLVQMGQPEYIPAAGTAPKPLSPFPEQPSLDLKVGRLGLGLDQTEGNIVLFAYEGEEARPKRSRRRRSRSRRRRSKRMRCWPVAPRRLSVGTWWR